MIITVIPEISTQEDLSNVLHRIGFYFGHRALDRVTIGRSSRSLTLEASERPEGFGDVLSDRLNAIASSIELTDDRSLYESGLSQSDVVLIWDQERVQSERWRGLIETVPEESSVVGVDLRHDRMEGSQYIQALFDTSPSVDQDLAESRRRFGDLVERLGGAKRAYLLATGPSIDRFERHDFSDGVVIACNTTVLDDELMDHADPGIVTFADPIFHFGCSSYAETFRKELERQAARHPFTIVIPLKYFELFVSLCPELEDRTIGVPMEEGDKPNLRLDSHFAVPSIDNIATLLMLPLACTLATDVEMLGFDGRSQGETYFWRHSRRAQLHDLLPEIRGVHPSFFNTDYDRYFDQHASNLERYLTAGERLGHSFRSLEESFIPALRRRTVVLDQAQFGAAFTSRASYRLVSLNPDLEDKFGHFELYDTAIREAAATDGGEVVVLASTAYEGGNQWIVPAFTDNSWSVRGESPEVHVKRFRREFEAVYELVAKQAEEVPTTIYMYTGSERHVVEMADVVAELGVRVPVLVNLFYSHGDLVELENSTAGPAVGVGLALTRDLREQLGIHVFVDSVGLQRLIHRHFGELLPLWPMFSVSAVEPRARESIETSPAGRPLVVYAPGNLQYAKGYDLVSRLAERLADRPANPEIRLVARSYFRHGTDRRLRRHAERLRENAQILDGVLSDEEYAGAFEESDVILVPYRTSHFATRTSAVISDAVRLGIPVVATHGTWIGDIVEEHDMGATFRDGDVADFERALWQVVRHIDYYRSRARAASERWEDDHNPGLLVDVMRDVLELWKASQITIDPADFLSKVRTTFDLLDGYESHSGTAVEDVQARIDLARTRGQLRAVKESAAFRLATKVVGFLKRLGPLYVPVRDLARRMAASGRSPSEEMGTEESFNSGVD